jgi:phenylalanyl-tRNA synthetase beta chain
MMKFTLSWLKEHLDTGEPLDTGLPLDAIVAKLTMIGLEVEYAWRRK